MIRLKQPRLAVRGIILHQNRLLIVNAYAGKTSDLWCAPGGGVEPGASLPDNLAREIYEETGLAVRVNAPALVNEFHDPTGGFHQVDIFFRCEITDGALSQGWSDPEGVVDRRRFVTRDELAELRHKPSSLGDVAWDPGAFRYDPLEAIVD